jgi:hypothetical protein
VLDVVRFREGWCTRIEGWRVGRNPSLALVIFHFVVFVFVVGCFLHSCFLPLSSILGSAISTHSSPYLISSGLLFLAWSFMYITELHNFWCMDEETICLYGMMLGEAFKRSSYANEGKAYVSEEIEA